MNLNNKKNLFNKHYQNKSYENFYFKWSNIDQSKLNDIKFLNSEIQKLENKNPEIYERLPYKEIKKENVVDTLDIARKLYPGKSVSLDSLCIKFDINNKRKGKHGALIDSEILSDVYLELIGGKQPSFQFSQKIFALTIVSFLSGYLFLI